MMMCFVRQKRRMVSSRLRSANNTYQSLCKSSNDLPRSSAADHERPEKKNAEFFILIEIFQYFAVETVPTFMSGVSVAKASIKRLAASVWRSETEELENEGGFDKADATGARNLIKACADDRRMPKRSNESAMFNVTNETGRGALMRLCDETNATQPPGGSDKWHSIVGLKRRISDSAPSKAFRVFLSSLQLYCVTQP
jgi:hypothetical protein